MISEKELRKVIEEILNNMNEDDIRDISQIDLKKNVLVPNPENYEGLLDLMSTTPARIGVWRAGPRPMTQTALRFRADHAIAMDAVFTNVSEEFIKDMNLFSVSTMCKDKDEFLTRPDLGKVFDEDAVKVIKERCDMNPEVQIFIADGLSSTAIEANAKDTLQAIVQGLKLYGIKIGTPFFVKHGRVPSMDVISEILNSQVTVVLIGERPGLATGESMSCYMAYRGKVGMPESNRTVISNIHKGGTPAVEAGAHIADIIKKMLEQKTSGLNLKL